MIKKILLLIFTILISGSITAGQGEQNNIEASQVSGTTPLIVDLKPINGSLNSNYVWQIDGQQDRYSRNTTAFFGLPGEYSVVLTITDTNGNTDISKLSISALDEADCSGDYDGDGFDDCADLCPLISGDESNRGCPLLTVNEIPAPDPGCFYQPEKNYLFGNAVCRQCPCRYKLDYNAEIRSCDILFPAIVSPDRQEVYETGPLFEIK